MTGDDIVNLVRGHNAKNTCIAHPTGMQFIARLGFGFLALQACHGGRKGPDRPSFAAGARSRG